MTGGAARTVLLVEDDGDSRELLREVLELAGYAVVAVATGAEAIDALAVGRVDLVLTDVGLPGVGGLEVARAAKAAAPPVPVILLTGYSERDDIEAARGREVDAVLVKPVDPDAVVAAVEQVAARSR